MLVYTLNKIDFKVSLKQDVYVDVLGHFINVSTVANQNSVCLYLELAPPVSINR